jgi:hypothetical protein
MVDMTLLKHCSTLLLHQFVQGHDPEMLCQQLIIK